MNIGFQKININPIGNVRRMLSCDMHQDVSDDLYCRVLAFKDTKVSICHLSIDTVELYEEMRERIKKIIEKHLGKDTQVITSATHSHVCPCLTTDKNYQHFLLAQLNKELAKFTYQEHQTISFTYNYQFFDKIGKSRISGHDSNHIFAETLSFYDREIRLGTLLIHNAHPTIKQLHTGDFTSEYPGKVIEMLEKQYPNEFFTFMLGPAGEISSRYVRKNQSYEEMVRLSSILAEEYIAQLEMQRELKKTPINEVRYEEKRLQIKHEKKEYDHIQIPDSIKGRERTNLLETLEGLKNKQGDSEIHHVLFSRLQFSNSYTIIFSPFEMVTEYYSYVNKATTSLVTISNGFEHYITEIECDYLSSEVLEDCIAKESKLQICELLKKWSI